MSNEKKSRVKRRIIYKDLDRDLFKDKKTLDKETYKIGDRVVKSQRLKNMEDTLKLLREKGEIADFGVRDIAEDLKTLKKGGSVKSKKKKNIKKSNNPKAITKKYFKGIF